MLGGRRCSCREETLARRRIAFQIQSLARVEHRSLIPLHFCFEDEAEVGESRARFLYRGMELSCDWLEEGANRGP
jgi:hypothetical protein